ncbi:MAG: hypothetical protein OXL97_12985 [Chloroflexota bacterium]|nr:hypothetical protein [Chloroflexota bacterium]MDE2883777.1 hypothetical protein [Chloroflexota bacterium]
MAPELTPDAFSAWARAVGLNADPEHLEKLRPEVEALAGRLAPLDAIPVDDIPIEQAVGGLE